MKQFDARRIRTRADGDADVQVSVSLIDTAGTEWHVTSGLLRLSDRAVDEERSDGLLVARTYAEADAEDVPADELVEAAAEGPGGDLVLHSQGAAFSLGR